MAAIDREDVVLRIRKEGGRYRYGCWINSLSRTRAILPFHVPDSLVVSLQAF